MCGKVGLPDATGKYVADKFQDGVEKWTNAKGMSMFRHNGYWYMGDLRPWPPVTYYRCVADCPKDEDLPPLVAFESNPKKGKDPAPTVQSGPCNDEL